MSTHEEFTKQSDITQLTEVDPLGGLDGVEKRLSSGVGFLPEDMLTLVKAMKEFRDNHTRHLFETIDRVDRLEAASKEGAKAVLLGLTIVCWLATLVAFLSIPLIGVACAATAIFSTACYMKARKA